MVTANPYDPNLNEAIITKETGYQLYISERTIGGYTINQHLSGSARSIVVSDDEMKAIIDGVQEMERIRKEKNNGN